MWRSAGERSGSVSEKVPFAEPAKPAPIKANGKAQPKAEVLVLASTLKPENHEWLWNGWLARTELHLIAGTPGVGKTTLALRMAATVSSGADWPDGKRCEPGNVLIWSGEDQPQKTILPRLLAMNADPRRILFVNSALDPERHEVRFFDPATDLPQLQSAIIEKLQGDVALIELDPISAAIVGDSHKNAEVRRSFLPLLALAKVHDCAVLGISHFAKSSENRAAIERVLGSIAFTAAPRVVLSAIRPNR